MVTQPIYDVPTRDAATLLGVSRGRIPQLVRAGRLSVDRRQVDGTGIVLSYYCRRELEWFARLPRPRGRPKVFCQP